MMKKLTVLALGAAMLAGCASAPERTAESATPVAAAIAPTPAPTQVPLASSQDPALGSLQIKDVVIGTGSEAVAGKNVVVHYTGRLFTGRQFDSSVGGPPFAFRLGAGKVIKGWELGVAGMKVGGKRQLVIPPHLAYGERGAPSIPPNATLVFDVELLGVE